MLFKLAVFVVLGLQVYTVQILVSHSPASTTTAPEVIIQE